MGGPLSSRGLLFNAIPSSGYDVLVGEKLEKGDEEKVIGTGAGGGRGGTRN